MTTSRNRDETAKPRSSQPVREATVETLIVIPPDGGWGWFVVVGSFLFNFISDGVMYTYGLFIEEIAESFEAPLTHVSFANSMMTGFFYLLGPLASGLTNRFGIRAIGLAGGCLATSAIMISSFVDVLPVFLFMYGFMGGLGFCMMYVTSIVVVGFYFDKWRALATSIAVCGTSTSMIVFPAAMHAFLEEVRWRPKFRIIAGACFLVTLTGLTFRPLKPKRITPLDDSKSPVLSRAPSVELKGRCMACKKFFSFRNKKYPTTAQVHEGAVANQMFMLVDPLRSGSQATMESVYLGVSGTSSGPKSKASKLSTVTRDSEANSGAMQFGEEAQPPKNCCLRCMFKRWHVCAQRTKRRRVLARPFYRDDIFYGGCLRRLQRWLWLPNANQSSMTYDMSVTRVSTKEEEVMCFCCHESMLRTMATMLDMSLLKSPAFILVTLSGFFTVIGMYAPFIYMEARAVDKGMDEEWTKLLISIAGVANTAGRVLSGALATLPNLNATLVSYVGFLICGTSTVLSFLSFAVWFQYAYSILFGLTEAFFGALRAIVVVELVGIEKLTSAFGISMTLQGIGCLIGVPLSSLMYDHTGDYNACFYFAGSSFILGGLLLIPVKAVARWEERRASN